MRHTEPETPVLGMWLDTPQMAKLDECGLLLGLPWVYLGFTLGYHIMSFPPSRLPSSARAEGHASAAHHEAQ